MEKKLVNKVTAKKKIADPIEMEFKPAEAVVATSPVKKRASKAVKSSAKTPKKATKKAAPDVTAKIAVMEPEVELSPAFKELAAPKLPTLSKENRARLLMQSPNKLYFYWSLRDNPYQLLHRAFGDQTGSYTLAIRFLDLKRGTEEIRSVEAEGNWWFTVEPDGEYQAEIGFYAPNRPYFRIVFSNTVTTPRKNPSPRVATDADWSVSANKFAEVLDVAGFSQDAFDVALAGDDPVAAEDITHIAFSRFLGAGNYELHGIAAEDIRYSMMALASGHTLEDLRWKISPTLFSILQANLNKLTAQNALNALTEYFDIDETEFVQEQLGAAVYGASLMHFPRTLKTSPLSPKFAPVSSHSLGS